MGAKGMLGKGGMRLCFQGGKGGTPTLQVHRDEN